MSESPVETLEKDLGLHFISKIHEKQEEKIYSCYSLYVTGHKPVTDGSNFLLSLSIGPGTTKRLPKECPAFQTWFSLPSLHSCYYLVTKSCLTLLWPYGLQPSRLLCPWDFPGKNNRGGLHFFLPGIFRSQGSNQCLLGLLHWQVDSFHWATRGAYCAVLTLFPLGNQGQLPASSNSLGSVKPVVSAAFRESPYSHVAVSSSSQWIIVYYLVGVLSLANKTTKLAELTGGEKKENILIM